MQEKLKKLEENSILILSNWWGLGNSGESKTIITKDKKIYIYTSYYKKTTFLEKNNIPLESLYEMCKLTDNDYNIIIDFIKTEIFNKKYESHMIFDAGYSVSGIYEHKSFKYSNCYDINTKESLYEKTKKLIDSFDKKN